MMDRLSPREHEILVMVAEGMSTNAIAKKIGISFRTVEDHRSHIYRKVGTKNHCRLIRQAMLLEPEMPCPCCGMRWQK